MTTVNPNGPNLQPQLQAQLSASQRRTEALQRAQAEEAAGTERTPRDVVSDRIERRAGEDGTARRVRASSPSEEFSSSDELEDASRRVREFTSQREAPVGRLSAQTSSDSEEALGQVIDILV